MTVKHSPLAFIMKLLQNIDRVHRYFDNWIEMNILVVEDDRDIRELVCQSLAQNDFRTIGCRGVQEARQTFAELKPDCLNDDSGQPDNKRLDPARQKHPKIFYFLDCCVIKSQHFFICISVITA